MNKLQQSTQGKRVLLIDDDEDYLFQQRKRLESAGYKVFTAENQSKAREALKTSDPEVVVVDLMMEQKDAGITLAFEFKRQRPSLPIIMVTGVTRETGMFFDAVTSEERSWIKADVILSKPVRFEQLQREIENLLSKQSA